MLMVADGLGSPPEWSHKELIPFFRYGAPDSFA